jgi:hypothetical protein
VSQRPITGESASKFTGVVKGAVRRFKKCRFHRFCIASVYYHWLSLRMMTNFDALEREEAG